MLSSSCPLQQSAGFCDPVCSETVISVSNKTSRCVRLFFVVAMLSFEECFARDFSIAQAVAGFVKAKTYFPVGDRLCLCWELWHQKQLVSFMVGFLHAPHGLWGKFDVLSSHMEQLIMFPTVHNHSVSADPCFEFSWRILLFNLASNKGVREGHTCKTVSVIPRGVTDLTRTRSRPTLWKLLGWPKVSLSYFWQWLVLIEESQYFWSFWKIWPRWSVQEGRRSAEPECLFTPAINWYWSRIEWTNHTFQWQFICWIQNQCQLVASANGFSCLSFCTVGLNQPLPSFKFFLWG